MITSLPNPHSGDAELDPDSKPLLTHSNEPSAASHEFHNPVYQPDYRYSYTDENFNHYPTGPAQSDNKLDEPFTPKPDTYNQPQENARQTRYEDMGTFTPFIAAANVPLRFI